MARSLNRVQLIGNLTRDPELRYTPNGTAVCSFGLATNRNWKTDTGEKREEAEFHNIVAWNKLAELCSQFLVKGRKAYVEGRIATRKWTGQDGSPRSTTEIVISDMIILDSKRVDQQETERIEQPKPQKELVIQEKGKAEAKKTDKTDKKEEPKETNVAKQEAKEDVSSDDIPF